jgi:hypothetical protein
MKNLALMGVLVLVGCTTIDTGTYRPKSGKEKAAFARSVSDVSPSDVQKDFHSLETTEMVWAGVISDIQFKETERTVQVAFQIDHRSFDWKDYGGGKPYRLSAEGDGPFVAGWTVDKPTSIAKLKAQAKPGYMILVYGKPYQMRGGVVQLSATALRLIKADDYEVLAIVAEDEVVEP